MVRVQRGLTDDEMLGTVRSRVHAVVFLRQRKPRSLSGVMSTEKLQGQLTAHTHAPFLQVAGCLDTQTSERNSLAAERG